MTDHDALLQAVLAAPDDDLPRLVFADFLEESGHPANVARAQFIRFQIEAEQVGGLLKEELLAKAEVLKPMFRDEWTLAEEKTPKFLTNKYYSRGFVYKVKMRPKRFARVGRRMLLIAPIRDIDLIPIQQDETLEEWQKALAIPQLTQLRRLRVMAGANYGDFDDQSRFALFRSAAVIDSQHLTGLTTLTLQNQQINNESLVSFITRLSLASFAESLRVLDLSHNVITDAGANTLAAGRGLDGLTRLDLRNNRLTADGIAMLQRRFGDRVVV